MTDIANMTTTSTLSRERLDAYCAMSPPDVVIAPYTIPGFTYGQLRALIGMAMRTEQAERERHALRADVRVTFKALYVKPWGYAPDSVARICKCCQAEYATHEDDCVWVRVTAALAEPDAGGDAS